MGSTGKFVSLAAAAVLAAGPAGAFTLLESSQKVPVARGETFTTRVRLTQAALGDGSVRFAPGEYRVDVLSMGDGSVRASFFDRSGRKAGEANGIIAALRKAGGGAAAGAPAAGAPAANVPAVQQPQGSTALKGGAASPSESLSLNFTKLGFGANSRANVTQQGQKMNVEILSSDGNHGILIGLLVPAVQKVREAAAKPH